MSLLLRRHCQLLSYSSYGKWLNIATKQAIIDAFLNDGYRVIQATNTYLDNLSTSSETKAKQLAIFINEDPMLVCSLGLQPQGVEMPIRIIANVNNAYILTDYKPNQKTEFYIKGKQDNSDSALFGNADTFYLFDNAIITYFGFDSIQLHNNIKIRNRWVEIELSKANGAVVNGTKLADLSAATDFTVKYGMALFGRRNNNGTMQKLGSHVIERAYAKEDGEYVARFVPSIHNGQNGIYDIDAKRWYGNDNTSGYFSITYILPDGTNWTPGTPIT